MPGGHSTVRFRFDAEGRFRAVERAREEAERARAEAERALAEMSADRDALRRTVERLWKEKKAVENEKEVLYKRISELTRQLAEATNKDHREQLALEIQILQRRLDDRNRALYGSRSERRPRQDDGKGEEDDSKRRPRRRKRSGARRTRQLRLPVVTVRHELGAEERAGGCKLCQGDLDEMTGQVERSEEITVRRIRYEMHVHERQKYRCKGCGWLTTAPGPDKLVVGGRYSPEFAAHSLVAKYADHVPLERQVRQMRRAGLEITSQALWDQHRYLSIVLLPTVRALHERILESEVCFVDEQA